MSPDTSQTMDLRGKKVTVVGLGRTAQAIARLLVREGATPWITEVNDTPELRETAEGLRRIGAEVELGEHSPEWFNDASMIVPSPGVSPTLESIQRAAAAGTPVVGEMEFASRFCSSRIIAVTGTNGKTTVTEWVASMIRMCGHAVALAGNNRTPFSEAVMAEPAPPYLVLEVSSYQCELIDTFRPWIAAVLNVTPDHLGRHGAMDAYAAAKLRLFKNQGVGDHAVVNADNSVLAHRFTPPEGAGLHSFSRTRKLDDGVWIDGDVIREGKTELARTGDIRLPGRHNIENALAALTIMRAGMFEEQAVRRALYAFEGVEHRLERVCAIGGVTYVNDSKATNLTSLRAALEAFDRPVILIAGGEGKGEDLAALADLVAQRVRQLIVIGRDGPLMTEAWGHHAPVTTAATMSEAVTAAAGMARQGDIVLLSPGCASFDMYDNFEARGADFKACVATLARAAARATG